MRFDAEFSTGIEWGPKQWEVLTFRPPPSESGPVIEIVGILGEFGGGKSFAAAGRFLTVCLENPYDPLVHSPGDEPLSAIVAPTLGDLKKGPLVQFLSICPEELILRMRLYGEYQDITLINGHRILLYSAHGALNGPTLCQLWADEIQERCYDGKWDNLQGRVRDQRAQRLNLQASGIAQRGHVEGLFRREDTANRITRLLFPEDNAPNLAEGYVDEMKDTLPGSRERDVDGWLLPIGARYPKFSRSRNMCRRPDLRQRRKIPTSMGIDLGTKAAVVFVQDERAKCRKGYETGQIVVDQMLPSNMDAEELADHIATKSPWNHSHGCTIALDPTAASDQVRHFRRRFPNAKFEQRSGGFYGLEENGIRAVDRAVCDLHHHVRLFVHPSLSGDPSKRGVVEMFSNWLELKPRDKVYEHVADALRYIIQVKLPLPKVPYGKKPNPEIQRRIAREFKPRAPAIGEVIY